MAIDEKYIPITSLNQIFFDKDTGQPLSGGELWFYQDSGDRNVPKTVYQISGGPDDYTYVPLTNPVILSSTGTVVNNAGESVIIYAYPYDGEDNIELYYVRCLSAGNVEQWTRGAIPHINTTNDPVSDNHNSENALSNAQFSEYFLPDENVTINVSTGSGTLAIAPDWDIVYTASSAATIQLHRKAAKGSDGIPYNPSYYLEIEPSNGVTNCQLRQRLYVNSGLWAGQGLSTRITGNRVSGTSNILTAKYKDGSKSAEQILSGSLLTGAWNEIKAFVKTSNDAQNLFPSDQTQVDILIDIPTATRFALTNIQVAQAASEVPYQQRSTNREKVMMGDWYIPRLAQMPTRNYLVGWDFNLNPAQFGSGGTISQDSTAGLADYAWDQTIVGRAGSNMTVARDGFTGGFKVTTAADNNSFYMMQYLEGADAKRLLTNKLAVNVNAYVSGGNTDNLPTMRIYLFGAPSSPTATFPDISTGNNKSIVDVAVDGTCSLNGANAANWFRINRVGIDELSGNETSARANIGVADNVSKLNNDGLDYMFNQWQVDTTDITDFDKFAIVVTFECPKSGQEVTVNSISLQLGDLATRPIPQTAEEVLKDCEYYYEKSYKPSVAVGTKTSTGERIFAGYFTSHGGASNLPYFGPHNFDLVFKTKKRAVNGSTPVTFYNPTVLNDANKAYVYNTVSLGAADYLSPISNIISMNLGGTNAFSLRSSSTTNASYVRHHRIGGGADTVSATGDGNRSSNSSFTATELRFHYIVDSRIGIV